MFNTSWNILVLNFVISSVHQWIYFSLFYPVGTKSAMANPHHIEVIIENTSPSVDFSAEAVAGASTSGLNSVSTSNLAGQNNSAAKISSKDVESMGRINKNGPFYLTYKA